ncbi:substrate-binding domain-containing protein [Streptomyces sp. NPDC002588]|uniref:substrate-binding domain-containing protein n=1 Tax=Streptomyces sp. NPDC002588 TaxID=3154419 RepID=UPI0033321758
MNTPLPAHPSRRATGSPGPLRLTAFAAVACVLLAGCSGSSGSDDSGGDSAGRSGGRLKIALITHGAKGDAFWERVRKGAEAAAAKDDVELTYASDADSAGQAELVRDAVRNRVDGIAVTLAKPQVMKSPVVAAKAAGIPVVGLNSGIDAWQSTGLMEYFGQDESVAGRAVGDKLDGLGAKHALCVIHERGNVALEARCAGVKKTFAGETDIQYADGTDMDALTTAVATRLQQEPDIDEVITNGAQFALASVEAAKKAGSKAKVATFDLNQDLVDAVRDGSVQFAVDQQPYLQGYLAVDSLWLYKTNGNISGGGVTPVLTGPAFVTKTNVADVARFAEGGTR